jgi:RND family efflux transporter MFP subunit
VKEVTKMIMNNPIQNQNQSGNPSGFSSRYKWIWGIFRFLLALGILFIAGYVSFNWLTSKPKARRKHVKPKAFLVEGTKIHSDNHHITIDAMGTVVPARSLDLTSRVSGEIIRTGKEFFPGGYLKARDVVVEIDKDDYNLLIDESIHTLKKASLAIIQSELAIEQSEIAIEQSELAILQREADIIKAEKDLKLEKGQQKIALREYEVLGEKISKEDEELVLRRPQLKAAEAALEAAKARLEEARASIKSAQAYKKSAQAAKKSAEAAKSQAEVNHEKARLNLKRTDILAPFNAVIQAKKVDVGSQVSIGTPIVTIVDSNEYWIQVSVPLDRLKWINIPNISNPKGSSVHIYHESGWGKGVFRIGTVKRLMTEVEEQGRMAKLLISVEDPLSLKTVDEKQPEMILRTYVRVEIEGSELSDVFSIPRTAFRDGGRVWILQPDNTLDIRKVEIAWSDKDTVYVTNNLQDGDFLITSDLTTPVQGMALRLDDIKTSRKADNTSKEKRQ